MLRCVIFDLDNTLVDSDLDFAAIKAEIGSDEPILEYRAKVDEPERQRIDAILSRHEERAAGSCALCAGAEELLKLLSKRGVRTGLVTRNSRASVGTVLRRHAMQFDCVLSREDSAPKPSPEPILLICRKLGIAPAEALMVGDYLYDIQCGQAAGTRTMLVNGPHRAKFTAEPDYEVKDLGEARKVIAKILRTEGN